MPRVSSKGIRETRRRKREIRRKWGGGWGTESGEREYSLDGERWKNESVASGGFPSEEGEAPGGGGFIRSRISGDKHARGLSLGGITKV